MSEETLLYRAVCPHCAIEFGFPLRIESRWRSDSKAFFCPNGHSLQFAKTPSEIEQLRKENQSLQKKITTLETDLLTKSKRIEELETELAIWRPRQEEQTR